MKPQSDNACRLYVLMKRQELEKTLKDRHKYLEKLEQSIIRSLKRAPEGTLRINRINGCPQYFLRTSPKDTNGSYIPAKKRDLAARLAQKAYNRKALAAVQKEARAVERFLKSYPAFPVEDIYERLSAERQKLVVPLTETDEMFAERWNDVSLTSGPVYALPSAFSTERGEMVRSKSEVLIADLLFKNNIPYRYEHPLYLNGLSTVFPDFTVLNIRTRKEYVWEHSGMMDDPEYAARAVQKICAYELNGYRPGENLILTFETSEQPLNMKLVRELVKEYLL
ncbi:MAG: hypothetical protein IJ930_10325 [Lachnospiraceae bacterium]|nr:hypothetical protein [Lachnospiraceae bacterium]